MKKFIFTTTGTQSPVKFEELGAYFDHPTSAYTLTDYFDILEISEAATIQTLIDGGHITATDENGNLITNLNYLTSPIPVFDIDQVNSTTSYIGYGEINACKIQRVITTGSTTYSSLWANGDESFNKIWANRLSYSYF